MLSDKAKAKRAAQMLKAMGNLYRLQIITLLMNGEKNVTEINHSVKISQPSLSQHLSRLRREGVLDARREQRQIYYYINNSHVPRLLAVANEMAASPSLERRAASR